MNTDGMIVIGTTINDKEFYDKIKEFDKTNIPNIEIKPEFKIDDLYEEIQKAGKELHKYTTMEVLSEQDITNIQTYIEYINKANERIEELGGKKLLIKGLNDSNNALQEMESNARKIDLKNVEGQLKGIGNSIEKVTKKVMRWGLSILGIRGAYSAVRRAISMVSAQNDEVANKMQQMKSVIAEALVPAVSAIVNWLAKAMVYINYIFHALTGKNLFDFSKATKSSSDDLKSGAKSAGGIADNLKEARKQLAGFDEMNILSDNVASAGGAGAIDAKDFGNIFDSIKGMQIPDWIEKLKNILLKLKEYWRELIIVVTAFAGALKAIEIAQFISKLMGIEQLSPKVSAGIGLMTAGILTLIGSVANLILNWDTMTGKEKVINGFLATVGAGFTALGFAIATGISVATLGVGALIAVLAGLITALVATGIKHEEVARKAQDEREQTRLLKEAKESAKKAYDDMINAIDAQETALQNLIDVEAKTKQSGAELYQQVQNGTLTYKEMTKEQREAYKAYYNLVDANNNVATATKTSVAENKKSLTQDYNDRISKAKTTEEYKKLKKEIVNSAEKGEISWKQASDSISRMMGQMSSQSWATFAKDIPDNIKNGLDPWQYRSTFNQFKDAWNTMIEGLNKHVKVGVGLNGFNITVKGFAKGGIVVPKLASGGIINQPGRGVPVGRAIAGESGQEGILPLTDSQQMELLGEAIGRYITINANITNSMNGRILSRELQRVQNENDFAMNR